MEPKLLKKIYTFENRRCYSSCNVVCITFTNPGFAFQLPSHESLSHLPEIFPLRHQQVTYVFVRSFLMVCLWASICPPPCLTLYTHTHTFCHRGPKEITIENPISHRQRGRRIIQGWWMLMSKHPRRHNGGAHGPSSRGACFSNQGYKFLARHLHHQSPSDLLRFQFVLTQGIKQVSPCDGLFIRIPSRIKTIYSRVWILFSCVVFLQSNKNGVYS